MPGETYITYTGIGGQNMDSEIMSAADISGSAHDNTENTEGKYPLSFVVSWQLPGGIQGKDAEGSGWGYIIGRAYQREMVWNSADFCAELERQLPGVSFDENGQLISGDVTAVQTRVNELVYDYFYRVINNDFGDNSEYDWSAMNKFYNSCITR